MYKISKLYKGETDTILSINEYLWCYGWYLCNGSKSKPKIATLKIKGGKTPPDTPHAGNVSLERWTGSEHPFSRLSRSISRRDTAGLFFPVLELRSSRGVTLSTALT